MFGAHGRPWQDTFFTEQGHIKQILLTIELERVGSTGAGRLHPDPIKIYESA